MGDVATVSCKRHQAAVVEDCGITAYAYSIYADDVQIYGHSSRYGQSHVSACLVQLVQAWTASNWLHLNRAKTEFIWYVVVSCSPSTRFLNYVPIERRPKFKSIEIQHNSTET